MILPAPVEVYLFASSDCPLCAKAKAEIVPALRAEGAFVVVIEDILAEHSRCGWTPKAYPGWLIARGGRAVVKIEGAAPKRDVLAKWRKAREA